jgi:uncharacterized repeat protein (TIGR03803 family)
MRQTKSVTNVVRPQLWTTACAACVLCATTATILSAQTFKTLHRFDGTDGSTPYAGLIQATNGNFYGTTLLGGTNSCPLYGCGTIFKITPIGELTTLLNFDGTDGQIPYAVAAQSSKSRQVGR